MKFIQTHAFMKPSCQEESDFLKQQIEKLKILTDGFFDYFLKERNFLNKNTYEHYFLEVILENIGPFKSMSFLFKKNIKVRVIITSGGIIIDSFRLDKSDENNEGSNQIHSSVFIDKFEFEKDSFYNLAEKVNVGISVCLRKIMFKPESCS